MLRLEKSGVEILPTAKVLKLKDYGSIVEANQIVAAAHAEADLIRKEAQKEFERQKQLGRQEGLEAGKAEISESMVDYVSRTAAYFSKLEDTLVDLVMRALRRVIAEFDRKDVVEQVVKRALESTRNEAQVIVRVSPAQADRLQEKLQKITAAFPKIQFLTVQADSRLAEDGCVLETEMGMVDASLETQLKAIEKALIKSMK